MLFPRFWVRDFDPQTSNKAFVCWGWSEISEEEARAHAHERSARVAAAFRTGGRDRLRKYSYGTRALREEVIEIIPSMLQGDKSATPVAIISRNTYGCLVLNTSRTMFVDIDLPELERSEWLEGFFSLFKRKKSSHQLAIADALQKIKRWIVNHPEWSWRIYRTRAGLRLIATHDLFEPVASASGPLFKELGADPLYQKLCVNQSSFRARLTPKPWRINYYPPSDNWPFKNLAAEEKFATWLSKYESAAATYATCHFLCSMGSNRTHPEPAKVIAIHDEMTKATSSLPLA